ncbi:MAG TPA: hypothetical protein VMM79_00530 [Longimicrobiales bacterium]|nr:hypothetical protein [Longimicrobiales bacterium]
MRSLVVMLDGVSWPVMDSLWDAGHFGGFHAPSRLISTFPSITGVAFRDIWHEPHTPGYEDRYYDRDRRRLAGGLLDHVFAGETSTSFHRHVDVMADGVTAGLAYIVPVTTARTELTRVRRAISERLSTDTTLVAYIVSTDALAHMSPREDLVAFLLDIETMVDELRAAAGPDLEITLFSDHGNDRVRTERVDIERELARDGLELAGRVHNENDVAMPRFGLVGSAFLYTHPASRERAARAIVSADGVDFVTWRDSTGTIHVLGRDGHARIEGDDSAYLYRPVEGDPLGLAPVVERMKRSGAADAAGLAPDSAWLAETLSGPYVDPLRRIAHGLRSVQNPADVIASLAPGYHFGDVAVDHVVGMQGTHGSLRTSSSLAFVMSSHAIVPDPVRTDALASWVALPRDDGSFVGNGVSRGESGARSP